MKGIVAQRNMAKKDGFNARVRIIEATSQGDPGQDSPILTELLKMAGWKFSSQKITGRTRGQQKESFLEKLTSGNERFIHVSAPGAEKDGLAVGDARVPLSGADIAVYCKTKASSSRPLKGRLITLSACGEISGRFPLELNEAAGVAAVVSPSIEIGFAESAVFMVLFYFALAKYPNLSALSSLLSDTAQTLTSRRIAHYIDSFQRSKLAYLGIGGTGAFRLDYWWQDEHICLH